MYLRIKFEYLNRLTPAFSCQIIWNTLVWQIVISSLKEAARNAYTSTHLRAHINTHTHTHIHTQTHRHTHTHTHIYIYIYICIGIIFDKMSDKNSSMGNQINKFPILIEKYINLILGRIISMVPWLTCQTANS